tara:strand:+ start:985 stop:1203 length:219 start_codon:yes stop_codon:yes gene_type:complete
MKKRKKRRIRTPRGRKILANKVITYYFDNPSANGYKYMIEKFNTDETTIRKILSAELDRRFKKAQENRDKFD